MKWDFALIKKFSSTSHSRLLNQVRNELKSSPICRTHIVREINDNKLVNNSTAKSDDSKTNSITKDSNFSNTNLDVKESSYQRIYDGFSNDQEINESDSKQSFRDRLKSVDLR